MNKKPCLGNRATGLAGGGHTDRISWLPDEIIHKILYSLDAPKQAARTSSLSRRWLHLWRSYPVLEFRHDEFDRPDKIIVGFIGRLATGISPRLLDSFRFSLPPYYQSDAHPLTENFGALLTMALSSKHGSPVEVVVGIETPYNGGPGEEPDEVVRYSLPEGAFSDRRRTKVLKLDGCDFSRQGKKVSLQGLQVLHLDNFNLTEQSLYGLVANAPNLESLHLGYFTGIKRLELSVRHFPKLKTLKISGGRELEQFQLTTAPFLQSLALIVLPENLKLRTVTLSSAPRLKFLRILIRFGKNTRLDLDEFIAKLPSLQVLSLSGLCSTDYQVLRTLMANAPHLRSLPIYASFGSGVEKLEIPPAGNLSELEIVACKPVDGTTIELIKRSSGVPSCLKTLRITDPTGMCRLDIESPSAAQNLKALKLDVPVGFSQTHLDDLIFKLPSLESLHLVMNEGSSSEMSKMRVSSRQLRVFELGGWHWTEPLEELEIDAPNLGSAKCCDVGSRFPIRINVVNVASDCRFVVVGGNSLPTEKTKEHCGGDLRRRRQWTYQSFLGLRQSLSALSQFHLALKLQSLDLAQEVSFDTSQAECTSPPLIIQHLHLMNALVRFPSDQNDVHLRLLQPWRHLGGQPSGNLWPAITNGKKCSQEGTSSLDVLNGPTFVDGLFWACRPKVISITGGDLWFAQFVYEHLTHRNVANCCDGAKCWRHELRDVKMENAFYDNNDWLKAVVHKRRNLEVLLFLTWY